MPLNEVFPNPVVKSVALELRFPNLFFLESKIGDFQVKIMRDFPESELLLKRAMFFTLDGENKSIQAMLENQDKERTDKVWQFKSKAGVVLSLSSKNLILESQNHKSYRLSENCFRSVIEGVLESFLAVTSVPVINRVGLRYIDECPVFERTTAKYRECYNSTLPLDRFRIEDAHSLECGAILQKARCQIRYIESFKFESNKPSLTLDFDAWAENVSASDTLGLIDTLHDEISNEFSATVREPILQFMRQRRES